MSVLARLDGFFRAPAPPARLALVRILVGLFGIIWIAVQLPAFARLAASPPGVFSPVGPLAPLGSPLPGAALYALLGAALLSGVAFVRGGRFRIFGPLFAAAVLVLASYRSSFGMIFHTDNLLVLHLLILALTPQCAEVCAPGRPLQAPPEPRFGWPLLTLGLATTLAYFLAGIAKLSALGLAWIDGSVLRGHVAYDALRKIGVGSAASPIGVAMMKIPGIFGPLAGFSLVLELGAPLALLHRKLGRLWCAGVWSFHVGVLAMMLIGFPYPLSGVAFASFFPLERLLDRPGVARGLRALTGSRENADESTGAC